jgi:transposase
MEVVMKILYERCAGLDVHKKTVVACVIRPDERGDRQRETRTFSTMTADLLALSDWLSSWGCTHVAMESTGDYWKPVFNLLEGNFEVWLVNPQHVKAVPGRKTDVKDADWLAELLQHGLLRASFIPPVGQREVRDLTRYRNTFIRERATLVNRVQKVLEDANIKLSSVATDVMGVSGRAMLAELIAGQTDATRLAELAKGRLREKREQLVKALEGRVKAHHRFVLTELLCQIDNLDETIARFDEQIQQVLSDPFEEAVALLDTIPGVARRTAELIVAEIGVDMSRFPTANDLAAWAGVAPGNHESAGKRYSGKTRKGNRSLRTGLTQAAHAATRTKTYLAAQYRRLAARRGKKRAILAVAHSILVMAYHMLNRKEPYREAGLDYFDKLRSTDVTNRLVKRLQNLGYEVILSKPTQAAVA